MGVLRAMLACLAGAASASVTVSGGSPIEAG